MTQSQPSAPHASATEATSDRPAQLATSHAKPRVSIGLPVYNGERYVEESIDSLLGQTFGDFELIICDNGSTDRTPEICRAYADRDPRVRFEQNPENLGVFGNHAKCFSLARGEYWFWAAHDDIRAPDFLARCVQVLDDEPETVICYSAIQVIGEHGESLDAVEQRVSGDDPDPVARFRSLIDMGHRLEPVMGLFRTAPLRATGAHGLYPDSDRNMLAELALRGRFHRIPQILFYRRDHATRSIRAHPSRHQRAAWIDPSKRTTLSLPYHRQLWEYVRSIFKVDLPLRQKIECMRVMAGWVGEHRRLLWSDYVWCVRVLLRPAVHRLRALRQSS